MAGDFEVLDKLDETIASAMDGADEREAAKQSPLDASIESAIDSAESRRPDSDADLIHDWDRKVRERYGRDAVRIVDEAHTWASRFRADPMTARQEFVSERMRDGFNGFTKFSDDKPASTPAKDDNVHSWVKLDRLLEQNIDRAEAAPMVAETYATFEQSAAAKLDELFGKDTPREVQLAALDKYLEAQHADPVAAADKLAAISGAPVTPLDAERLQHVARTEHEVDTLTGHLDALAAQGQLVGLNDPQVIQDMLTALQHPQFPRSGDQFQDVVNANRAALQVAATRRAEANRQAVEKAQRAAPIAASGGVNVSRPKPESGVDAAISNALGDWD